MPHVWSKFYGYRAGIGACAVGWTCIKCGLLSRLVPERLLPVNGCSEVAKNNANSQTGENND